VATHEGSYDDFSTTYGHLCAEWLPANGYQCRNAPALEVYHNDPQNTRPEDLRTDICVPVERAEADCRGGGGA
jgi:AraC family transcriptional regulator